MAWFRMMGADSTGYHRRTVLDGGDDHPGVGRICYGTHGETPLRWGGSLAARLGLEGAVDDAGYGAIFGVGGAVDPHLAERMVRTRRPGVELVVSAHKSVAVLGVLGAVDDMHDIVDAETEATMAFLDAWFCRQGGRRDRAQTRTATAGLLWARTRHLTTRGRGPRTARSRPGREPDRDARFPRRVEGARHRGAARPGARSDDGRSPRSSGEGRRARLRHRGRPGTVGPARALEAGRNQRPGL